MRKLIKFLLVIVLLIVSVTAQAAGASADLTQLDLEQLLELEVVTVYGASKFEQKVTEAPASISIVSDDEIKKYGYRTIADILKSVKGFYITTDRNYTFIGVRGFGRPSDYNTRILLLVDGHRLNDNIFDGAFVGTESVLDVDLIDRVEVIRGPSSSLYGTNAFFAVVNVITKRGKDLKGMEISGEAGSLKTYKGRLNYGNKFQNGMELLISGSAYDSQGKGRLFYKEFNDPATNNGIAENTDGDKYESFFTKLSFHDFTLHSGYSYREKRIPTASYGTVFNSSGTYTVDEWRYIDLKYEHDFSKKIDVMARLYYDRYYYFGDYLINRPPVTQNKDSATGEWWGGELKFAAKPVKTHKLILGFEYRDNLTQDQGNYDESPYSSILNYSTESNNRGVYLQDEISIIKDLILNLGLRYDYSNVFGENTSPRLALIYSPLKKTTFKLLYGAAFRYPNAYELYYDDGGTTQKANTNLKAEEIQTYEAVYEQYLGEHFRSSVSYFQYNINDLISQETDPADGLLVFRNVEEIKAKGTELEMEGVWANGLQVQASYTYQETENN
ncbi:MAG: TonB-dependent receptor [Nitrospirae bacterium]|nr:TonB-dependent receptor [Nitrospirota bacterium]